MVLNKHELQILAADFASVDTARTGTVPVSALPALLAAHLQRQPTPTESRAVAAVEVLSSAVTFAAWFRWVCGEDPPADAYVTGASLGSPDLQPGQQCLWLCGDPGSGKTFLGDYLATRGWHHIDGDQGNQSTDPDVKGRWAKLYQAMTTLRAEPPAAEAELWRPYYDFLLQQYNEAIKTGKNVVLSFALLDMFGERPLLQAEIPGLKFVVVHVSEDLLLDRVLERNKVTLDKAGTTEEEVWKQDYMAEYRTKYGDEYTPDRFRQMMVDGAKEQVYVKKGEQDVIINNDDWESNSAVKELNQLVGLEWEDIDSKQIADVNMKRMENLNLEM